MKRFICALILSSAAALCGCVAQASTASSATASPPPAKTSAFADTSWSPAVKTVLAEYKAARGGAAWDHIHSLRTKATIEVGGLSGSWTMLDNLRTGLAKRNPPPTPLPEDGKGESEREYFPQICGKGGKLPAKAVGLHIPYRRL